MGGDSTRLTRNRIWWECSSGLVSLVGGGLGSPTLGSPRVPPKVSEEGHHCNRLPSLRTELSERRGGPPWGAGCRGLREGGAAGLCMLRAEGSELLAGAIRAGRERGLCYLQVFPELPVDSSKNSRVLHGVLKAGPPKPRGGHTHLEHAHVSISRTLTV